MAKFIVGVSGASGALMAESLIKALVENGDEVYLVFSKDGLKVFNYELGFNLKLQDYKESVKKLFGDKVFAYGNDDFFAPMASGTFKSDAMIIVPCSMKSVSAVANGLASGLIERAADVMIKEKKKLILVPRETPLSAIHLGNLLKLSELGVSIIPPMPAFYNFPKTISDVVDHFTGKILDQLGVSHTLYVPWGE